MYYRYKSKVVSAGPRPPQPGLDVAICDVELANAALVCIWGPDRLTGASMLHLRLVIADLAGDSHSLNPQKKAQNQRCRGLPACAAQKTFR